MAYNFTILFSTINFAFLSITFSKSKSKIIIESFLAINFYFLNAKKINNIRSVAS